MRQRLVLIFISCCLLNHLAAQTTVQWAARVVDVSSELSELEYSARQVLGKPNVLPAGGSNPNAWRAYRPNEKEFIKVEFELAIPIKQIAIGESFNPGAVVEIFGYNEEDTEFLLYEKVPGPVAEQARLFRVFVDQTPFNIKAIKITFDGRAVDGYSEIDCIGVSNSDDPIEAAINLMANLNSQIGIERLNDKVNSTAREIKPLLTKDEQTLYFSRRGHPGNIGGLDDLEDIWYTDYDSVAKDWKTAKNIGPPLNNEFPNFISAFLQEEEEYIILGNEYSPDGRGMRAGISKSVRTSDNSWSFPQNMSINNDVNTSESVNYWLTRDDEVLIISKEGPITEGQRDLYVSFLQKDEIWTEPLHLGDIVNTAGEEESPYLMPDKRTLFFSSNGHGGYGKKDLFMSRRLDNTWKSWTEPQNLGPLINSPVDDLFMFIPLDGTLGYFSREVEGNDLDIHSFTLPLVTKQLILVTLCGVIEDPKTGEPLDAEVVFTKLRDGEEVGRVRTDESGNYCIELPAGEIYSYRAIIPGYLPVSSIIDLRNVDEFGVQAVTLNRLDIDSAQIAQGEPIGVPQDVVRGVPIQLTLPELVRDTLNAQRKEIGLPPVNNNITNPNQPVYTNVNPTSIPAVTGATFILRNAFFDFDKSDLKKPSWVLIRDLVEFMNQYPEAVVELAGHTDNTGTEDYNIGLSMRRVMAVKEAMMSLGVAEERLTTAWYGESLPIANNRTAKGRRLNRRVEFTVLKLE